MANYIGFTPDQIFKSLESRFFYGLRRTDQGELFLGKVDKVKKTDSLNINKPGDAANNFPNFQEGQDFYEGRNVKHELLYENLNYEQFRWDDSNIFYYVDEEGELTARINEIYTYDNNSSSEGTE